MHAKMLIGAAALTAVSGALLSSGVTPGVVAVLNIALLLVAAFVVQQLVRMRGEMHIAIVRRVVGDATYQRALARALRRR